MLVEVEARGEGLGFTPLLNSGYIYPPFLHCLHHSFPISRFLLCFQFLILLVIPSLPSPFYSLPPNVPSYYLFPCCSAHLRLSSFFSFYSPAPTSFSFCSRYPLLFPSTFLFIPPPRFPLFFHPPTPPISSFASGKSVRHPIHVFSSSGRVVSSYLKPCTVWRAGKVVGGGRGRRRNVEAEGNKDAENDKRWKRRSRSSVEVVRVEYCKDRYSKCGEAAQENEMK